MKRTFTLLTALSRARTGHFLAISGLWLTMCADSFALIPPHGKYHENTETVPVEDTITEGGIRMKIENTIRLTPAPISAHHPFLKALRLNNGDLIVNCPLSGETHRDYDPDKQVIYERKEPMSLQYGNSMIQLSDGKILCAGQIDRLDMILKGQTFMKGCSYGLQFRTSADRGKTWQEAGQFSFRNLGSELDKQGDNAIDGYGEPWLLRAANGDLLVFVRVVKFLRTGETVHRPKYPPVKVARSKDEGKTWSEPIEVHPTGVMPVATLLDNGIIVAFTGRGGNRVAASRDNGLTWHCHHNLMFTGQSPNFSGHNAIVPVGGGRALLIYTHNHSHPDNEEGFREGNRYGAELIGTFVSFSGDVR
ncbi:MAG: sialidase family protein [Candidatus Hydrogenedentes bacterium]|nr:sialidase family protein [Candidatus Hydrogenedentota bacterium]